MNNETIDKLNGETELVKQLTEISESYSNSKSNNLTKSFPFLKKQSHSLIRPSNKKLIDLVFSLKQKNILYKTNSDLKMDNEDYLTVNKI